MNLRQQIVQERVEKTVQDLSVTEDVAFARFVHTLIVGQSMHAFDPADFVDGGQDKQVDIVTLEQDDNEATVYIVQAKKTTSFSSNVLIQMRNGLDWVFNKSRADVNRLANMRFKDRITEYRSIQSAIGPSNIHVQVAFVTNGLEDEISEEFKQEEKTIRDQYDNDTFASFEFRAWGANELVTRMNALEKRDRKINEDIRIRYDANNPSLIRYHAEGLKGIICSATAREIARVVNDDITGSVFDANIRRFLGTRGAVNSDIFNTCSQADESYLFWFLNNGVTIVCEHCEAVTDPDNPHVKIKNMQIVNGCQTATTLAMAEREGKLAPDTRVLLRIYEAADSDLVDKIVLTTNNQNKINSRDLRANDPVQVDMERAFASYGYSYERKPRQYDNQDNIDVQRIIANEIVAQSYLAVVLKKPSDARRRKYKVWGELYETVFSGHMIEPHVIATSVYRHAVGWLRQS